MAAAALFLVNGQESDLLSVADRGFAFGDGLFETLRLQSSAAPLWPLHRERLLLGCQRLHIPFSADLADAAMVALLDRCRQQGIASATVKITVTRGIGPRGYGATAGLAPSVIAAVYPGADAMPPRSVPKSLCICDYRLPSHPALAGIKHLNRLDNVMLKLECDRRGFADGLVLDYKDQIVEAVASNVFLRINGVWHTPPLTDCGVAGIARRMLLEQVAGCSAPAVVVQPIPLASLADCDQAFLTNAITGIQPVAGIGSFVFAGSDDIECFSRGFERAVSSLCEND